MKHASIPVSFTLLLFCLCLVAHVAQVTAQQPPATQQPPPAVQPPPGFDRPSLGDKPPRQMSVDEAVELAFKQASIYLEAQLDESVAREDVKQARAAFLPRLSVPLAYLGTTPSQYRLAGEPRTFSYVSASAINETIALFQAAGEIDVSGRLRNTLRRNRSLLEAARDGSLVARRALVLQTVDSYYTLVLARQRRRLAEETLSLAEGFVKVVEGQQQRGEDESEGADVLRARAGASMRRDELTQARVAESVAMDALRTLTGVDFATPIAVTRIAQDLPTATDFAGYTEELLKTRPELAQVDAQRRAAEADAGIARSERLPQLSYTLSGGFDAADFRPLTRYAGGAAIVSLNIPVFDFGASKSRETQARLRAKSLAAGRELVLRALQREFYTARAVALNALARIKETDEGATNAQKNLLIVFARYRAKKTTITDVVDAQAAYAEARMAYFQAIIDYRTARIRLEQDLGGNLPGK